MTKLKIALVIALAATASSCSKSSIAEIPATMRGETRMGRTTGNDTMTDSQFRDQQQQTQKQNENGNRLPSSMTPTPSPSEVNRVPSWPYAH